MAAKLKFLSRTFEAEIDRAVAIWEVEPPVWGETDCLLSLANIVDLVKGYDPAAEFRGRYRTKLGALRVTRKYGGFVGALDAMARRFKWEAVTPSEARVGAIGIIGEFTFAIKHRSLWLQRVDGGGFGGEPNSSITRAWRIP